MRVVHTHHHNIVLLLLLILLLLLLLLFLLLLLLLILLLLLLQSLEKNCDFRTDATFAGVLKILQAMEGELDKKKK